MKKEMKKLLLILLAGTAVSAHAQHVTIEVNDVYATGGGKSWLDVRKRDRGCLLSTNTTPANNVWAPDYVRSGQYFSSGSADVNLSSNDCLVIVSGHPGTQHESVKHCKMAVNGDPLTKILLWGGRITSAFAYDHAGIAAGNGIIQCHYAGGHIDPAEDPAPPPPPPPPPPHDDIYLTFDNVEVQQSPKYTSGYVFANVNTPYATKEIWRSITIQSHDKFPTYQTIEGSKIPVDAKSIDVWSSMGNDSPSLHSSSCPLLKDGSNLKEIRMHNTNITDAGIKPNQPECIYEDIKITVNYQCTNVKKLLFSLSDNPASFFLIDKQWLTNDNEWRINSSKFGDLYGSIPYFTVQGAINMVQFHYKELKGHPWIVNVVNNPNSRISCTAERAL